jgi:hypothetical protein
MPPRGRQTTVCSSLSSSFQFALGFSLARWWALLLPLFVVVFSVPLPDGSDAPGWWYLLLGGVPPAMLLIGAGVTVRMLMAGRSSGQKPQ